MFETHGSKIRKKEIYLSEGQRKKVEERCQNSRCLHLFYVLQVGCRVLSLPISEYLTFLTEGGTNVMLPYLGILFYLFTITQRSGSKREILFMYRNEFQL